MQRTMPRLSTRGAPKSFKHKQMLLLFALLFIVLLFSLLPGIYFAEQVRLPVRKAPRTVVSISSFSQRVFHLRRCLDSVFTQSQLPDRVIITIPRTFRAQEKTAPRGWSLFYKTYTDKHQNETEADIVKWFSDYAGNVRNYRVNMDVHNTSYVYEIGKLTVQFVDQDWGPATKLIGALLLEKDAETVIITLDDDIEYSKYTVQWLATHIQPGIALSFGCEMWTSDRSTTIDFTMWSAHDFYMSAPRVCDGWLVGWTGVAYHVSSFGPDIYTFVKSLPVACFNTDDIWLSGYIAQRRVKKVYAPTVLYHGKHEAHLELSLQTIVTVGEKAYSCASYLFPEP